MPSTAIDKDPQSPAYGYNGTKGEADEQWANVVDNVGEPEEVRAREKRDDAAFEAQTHMPGASAPGTKEEDKTIIQKVVDKVAGVNDEASREYLAS